MPKKQEESKPVSAPAIKDTRGGKPKYNNYRDFRKKVDDYFVECNEQGVFPDEKGMYVFMNIFEEDIEPLISEENPNADEYLRILKLARYRRESWLSRNMVADNKMASGCMNALKQEQNGGYTDRPTADKKQRVEVVLPGGMTMDLFK